MPRYVSVIATVALVGGLVAVTAAPAQAATLTVNSTADTATSTDGACTLREAIANANADADTTGGDCTAGSGTDTITFASNVAGTITLTDHLTVTDADGLTITGPGAASLTISGDDAVRVFLVNSDAVFAASGLTLADGRATFDGGALLSSGTVTLTEIVASGNAALAFSSGGAISNSGVLNVVDSTFTNNTAAGYGGAIHSLQMGRVAISGSTFDGNSAASGGAVGTFGPTRVETSMFAGNSAEIGGAVTVEPLNATVMISKSTFEGNTADTDGGAVHLGLFNGLPFGGMLVERSTFSENAAGGRGGAIGALGPLDVDASTFSGNSASEGGAIGNVVVAQMPLTVRNTTFAGNMATAESGAATLHRPNGGGTVTGSILSVGTDQVNCVAPPVDGGANVDSGSSCGFSAPSGAAWGSDVDALLSPLGDNGGPTETLLPVPGSPVLDAIDPGQLGCPGATPAVADLETDQRGVTRPQGPKCDIGAVEVVPEPVAYTVSMFGRPVVAPPGTTYMKAGDTLPLRFSVTDQNGALITDIDGDDVEVFVLLAFTCTFGDTTVALSIRAGTDLQLLDDGTYQYNLKTRKSWAGLCGTVEVNTPNGGTRSANLLLTGGGRQG